MLERWRWVPAVLGIYVRGVHWEVWGRYLSVSGLDPLDPNMSWMMIRFLDQSA